MQGGMQGGQGAHLPGHVTNILPHLLRAQARAPTWHCTTKSQTALHARAHVRKSLNVDLLTLDLEITAILFLALIITEICSNEVLTIHLALQLKFETVKLGPLGHLLYLDFRFGYRR